MPLRLRDDLSVCCCAGRFVFLDLRADRYFCLAPSLEAAFARWFVRPDDNDDARLSPLLEAGLLMPTAIIRPSEVTAAPIATCDLSALSRRQAKPQDIMAALAIEIGAAVTLRLRSLRAIVAALRAKRELASLGEPAAEAPERIAAAFAHTALLTGASDRCLVRAIAAFRLCRRRDVRAALLFGVRLNPFAAHCWVQIGDAVLVGNYEEVRLFTPILTVR